MICIFKYGANLLTLSRHLDEKSVSFLHLEPPYHNISHTCLFVYLNFLPFLKRFCSAWTPLFSNPCYYVKLVIKKLFLSYYERQRLVLYINNTKCPLINMELMKNIYFHYFLNDPCIMRHYTRALKRITGPHGPGPLGAYGPELLIIWRIFWVKNMLQDHIWNAHCSRSMFATCCWSSMLVKYGPGAYLT